MDCEHERECDSCYDKLTSLREENARLRTNNEGWRDAWAVTVRERDEARVEVRRVNEDALDQVRDLVREVARQQDAARLWRERGNRWQDEVKRLEGLILDWDEGWMVDPIITPGKVKQGDEALAIEARRIRAQREEGK